MSGNWSKHFSLSLVMLKNEKVYLWVIYLFICIFIRLYKYIYIFLYLFLLFVLSFFFTSIFYFHFFENTHGFNIFQEINKQ